MRQSVARPKARRVRRTRDPSRRSARNAHPLRRGAASTPVGPGPPIKEPPNVTSPALTETAAPTEPQSKVRRSRKAIHLSIGLVAVVGLAFATTACTPEMQAKDAIA